jgi:hypothetical protein
MIRVDLLRGYAEYFMDREVVKVVEKDVHLIGILTPIVFCGMPLNSNKLSNNNDMS